MRIALWEVDCGGEVPLFVAAVPGGVVTMAAMAGATHVDAPRGCGQ